MQLLKYKFRLLRCETWSSVYLGISKNRFENTKHVFGCLMCIVLSTNIFTVLHNILLIISESKCVKLGIYTSRRFVIR